MTRGQMLGMLCEMHEPPGCLLTRDHGFVQIDNKLMFSRSAGADLCDSPWVTDDGRITQSGLDEAVCLCEQVLSLPDEVFQEALRLPPDYRPRMIWRCCGRSTRSTPGHRHSWRRQPAGPGNRGQLHSCRMPGELTIFPRSLSTLCVRHVKQRGKIGRIGFFHAFLLGCFNIPRRNYIQRH